MFVCTLETDGLTELRERLGGIIDADTDSVHVFRQCAACWDDAVTLGQGTFEEPPYYWAVL